MVVVFVSNRWKSLSLVGLVALAAGAAGCTEKLESGAACPALCPSQDVNIRDTTIDAVITSDTTVRGFPVQGREELLLVANRPDTLESWAVVRFDTLPTTYKAKDSTRALTTVRNARLRLWVDTTGRKATAPVTVRAYEVDTTTAHDTSLATLRVLQRSGRLIGSVTRAPAELKDTLVIPLSDSAVGAKTSVDGRIRILLTVESTASAQVRFRAWDSGIETEPRLIFEPPADRDTTDLSRSVPPTSVTPTGFGAIAGEFIDYTIVARQTPAFAPRTIAVGGLPSARALLRFTIPQRFIDSVTVLRATLVLTQEAAAGSVDAADSITLVPLITLASKDVVERDPLRATSIATREVFPSRTQLISVDSVRLVPGGSGERRFEMTSLIRYWRQLGGNEPQALVLQVQPEGSTGAQLLFASSKSTTVSARPRLRIQYIDRVEFGLP